MNISKLPARKPGETDLTNLLNTLGVRKESLIQITGPDGLGLLLWFCRHGYDHAAYVKCGTCCPSEPADALVAPHAVTHEELYRLLDGAPKVRPGGALLIQVKAGSSSSDDGLPELLERYGYRVTARFDRGERELVAARRIPNAYAEAA